MSSAAAMPITYSDVKPWGRSFAEYVGMFALSDADLHKRILGCADGPASFNAEASAQGLNVTSIDPIYNLSAAQIEQRIGETWQEIMEQMRPNMDSFVWTHFKTLDDVRDARLNAMRQFTADLERGKREGRYVDASLPELPFEDGQFDLALCSNCLFMYSDHFTTEFHITSIREMCRVADEVRIFPLLDLNNRESVHVIPVIEALQADGWQVERVRVDYEFLRGANQILHIHH